RRAAPDGREGPAQPRAEKGRGQGSRQDLPQGTPRRAPHPRCHHEGTQMKRLLLAIAALATLPAAHAQTHEVAQAGVWHIMSSANECTALYHYDDQDILAALIYPRPGKKPDAALMFKSSRLFGDAKDHEPYPVRLVLG